MIYFRHLAFPTTITTLDSSLIIHRLSIDNPSILHRFDGLTMEMRWSNDGVSMEEECTKSEGISLKLMP